MKYPAVLIIKATLTSLKKILKNPLMKGRTRFLNDIFVIKSKKFLMILPVKLKMLKNNFLIKIKIIINEYIYIFFF